MASWPEILGKLNGLSPEQCSEHITSSVRDLTDRIRTHTGKNVLFYASGFLQKAGVPGIHLSINMEDINGFMAGLHGMDFSRDLILILHTPGGMAEAAETIVDYLRSKFARIDAYIPTYAMSAGTMIALSCDTIVMGRQSQLGPTDPQLLVGQRPFSAHSIVAQFDEAKAEIQGSPILAHAWAPVLQPFGPALLQEARRALVYGRDMVAQWLEKYMLSGYPNARVDAVRISEYFGGAAHASHGRRINRDVARSQGLKVTDLEPDKELQDLILTLYHYATITFEQSPAVKVVISSTGQMWIKNFSAQGAIVRTA